MLVQLISNPRNRWLFRRENRRVILLIGFALYMALSGCKSDRNKAENKQRSARQGGAEERAEHAGAPDDAQKELLDESLVAMFHQQMDAQGYPAIVVAVVDGDDSRVYGFGQLAPGVKPDGDTLFELGSITKTFTGLLPARCGSGARPTAAR